MIVEGHGARSQSQTWNVHANDHPPEKPSADRKNVLITSALPYVNNTPHLGNIIGSVLSADCYARYCRSRQLNVLFICGTDEHGTATEIKAMQENLSCRQICDRYHRKHRDIYEWLHLSFNHFGRTSADIHAKLVQNVFDAVLKNGHTHNEIVPQMYSEAAGVFLADRFVTGRCPDEQCAFDDARGDQCDKCGRLLHATELIDPRCAITGSRPVLINSDHIYFDLPHLESAVKDFMRQNETRWSSNCKEITRSWLSKGLHQRCITRDLKWGVPVPLSHFADKVFYVWFDAPIGYISMTAQCTQHWESWWKNPEGVQLVQFMGKDNVPFHTIMFPATLLATGEKWTLAHTISVTEYLTCEGEKFSKSRGTGISGDDAKNSSVPAEMWRYYLLSIRPEVSDTDFKWSDMVTRVNSELKNNFGNFVHRILKFVTKPSNPFDSKMPAMHHRTGRDKVEELARNVSDSVRHYVDCMDRMKMRESLRTVMAISAMGNKFFQDHKVFKLVKDDVDECATLLNACLGLVLLSAALIAPFIPTYAEKILTYLDLPYTSASLTDDFLDRVKTLEDLIPVGHLISEPEPLVGLISIGDLRAR